MMASHHQIANKGFVPNQFMKEYLAMWAKDHWMHLHQYESDPLVASSFNLSEDQLDLIRKKKDRRIGQMYRTINLILFPPPAQVNSTRPILINVAKIVGVVASYAASYPFIKPAESVTDNQVLKKCFAAGEFLAWGTLTAWSACKLIDRISKGDNSRKKSCHPVAYWLPLYCLGIASEIPSAYISYHYNQSLFWAIYTPLLYSLFGTQSMDALIQKIAHTNNPLTRCLYKKTLKPSIFKAKDKFCKILEKFLSDAICKQDSSFKHKLLEIANSERISENDKCAFALLHMLKVGLEIKMKTIESRPVCVRFGNRAVQVLGSAGSLAMSGVDGYLVYKSGDLLIESRLLIALIVFVSVAPSAYLSLDINRKNYSDIFLSIVNLKSTSASQLPNRIGNVASLLITCFGLGSLFTVLKDSVGFEAWWAMALSISVLIASGILTTNALNAFFSFAIDEVRFLKMNPDQKRIVEFNQRLQNLIDYFKTAPTKAFHDFLTALQTEGVGVEEFNAFFEKLKAAPGGQTLIQKIENRLKSIENDPIEDDQEDNSILI